MIELGLGVTVLLVLVIIIGLVIAAVSVVIVSEFERVVVLTLGRFTGVRKPGLRFVVPFLQDGRRVDMREKTTDIPQQEALTKDGVRVRVNGVVYYSVKEPKDAILRTENYESATIEMAQSTLRSTVGTHDLADLADAERISVEIQRALEVKTDPWGIKVSNVEIKEVELPKEISRAMSRVAEAERLREARKIEAKGEKESAGALLDAAKMLSTSPEAMQLRYLATLSNIASDRSSTIVFPFPTDLAQALGSKLFSGATGNGTGSGSGNGSGNGSGESVN
jgi:regulator of protease activity HflC (stomatin/prohibitin superfamily)